MAEFKWAADDVERLISASKSLYSSSDDRRQSSYDNAELLLTKPQFINSLILEIVSQQQQDEVVDFPPPPSGMSERWKKIIGELRWLLSRSLIYNFNLNSQTEASLYFSTNPPWCRSDPGKNNGVSSNTLEDLVKWFPDMTVKEIRKHVNSATFMVETLPPKSNRDVELDKNNRVTKWKAFNSRKDGYSLSLSPVGDRAAARASQLKALLPETNVRQRYGLQFEAAEGNMYGIAEDSGLILRDKTSNVVLTLTFLVGKLPDDDDGASAAAAGGEEEQFILNDYRYSARKKTSTKHMRALSIEIIKGGEEEEDTFDLYLYGTTTVTAAAAAAAAADGTRERRRRRKIGTGLKTSWFYTVQIKWGGQDERGVHCSDSFYVIRENDTVLTKKSFLCPPLKDVARSALYLGGLNTAKTDTGVVVSNCFSGIVSNIEILKTNSYSRRRRVPESVLEFIIANQIIMNDDVVSSSSSSSRFIKNDVFLS